MSNNCHMTIVEAMTADLRHDGTITGLRHWAKGGRERTYIQVAGYDGGYRGCKTHQLYWDHQSRQLVDKRGQGMAPSAYNDAVARVVEAFHMRSQMNEDSNEHG